MAAATNLYKLHLLMWKNFLVQRRHIVRTAFELLFPAIFALPFCLLAWYEPDSRIYLVKSAVYVYCIIIAYAFICGNTVRAIVMEKEKQLSETMKIMGLTSLLQWSSWFLRTTINLCIMNALIVLMISLSICINTNWLIFWMLFFIYGISITMLSFVMSTFFSKASLAFFAANVVWLVAIIPHNHVTYNELTFTQQLLMCLSPNIAMLRAMEHINRLESLGFGLSWSNMWRSSDDDLAIGIIMIIMLITSVVLFPITLYVERVLPGTYGVALPWYFPFTKSFWFGKVQHRDIPLPKSDGIDLTNFEDVPENPHANVGIHIRNFTKIFRSGKVAVDDLSVNMFENQITVLLGHNGAGKSTAISMLTGMLQPTSGTALVNGFDIRTETGKARSSFGVCAQNNILFDELTVREHILFHSKLKGLDSKSGEQEVRKYTNSLNLEPGKVAGALSGGMKRKLSVAIALCGGSKIVLCDEPSSGMDPAARRELWKVLQDEKMSRTILLTTHYMDEADTLGDRIAIMAEGRLKCCGSSFFLKKRFGAGYHLICVKEVGCDSREVTKLLRKYLPKVNIATDIGTELSYHLPDDDTSFFGKMFSDLENNMQSLQLSSFGVSLTTLEDVFHKVGTDHVEINDDDREIDVARTDELFESCNKNLVLLQGFALVLNQWYALFKKKYVYWKRNWIIYAILNILVIISMAFAASGGSETQNTDSTQTTSRGEFVVQMAVWLGLLFPFISASYSMCYIKERTCKSKLLQLLSGVNVVNFWAVSFLWDFFTFIITTTLIIVTIQIRNQLSLEELRFMIIVLFVFGFAVLPMTYVFSLLFEKPSSGLTVIALMNIITGPLAWVVGSTLAISYSLDGWNWIFKLFPHCVFIDSFFNLRLIHSKCNVEDCSSKYFAWEEPGIGRNLVFMFGTGIFYFALLLLNEYRVFQKFYFFIWNSLKLKFIKIAASEEIDADVLEEKKRVDSLISSKEFASHNLILQNLTRFYGNFVAVNRLSLAVQPFEIFGLLGVNGAGKTTTFKMLTGDKYISDGDAWLSGVSVKTDLSTAHKMMAYCPQFDALLDDFTGRETLEIFGILHGIRHTDIAYTSHTVASRFDFIAHIDKKVSELSGGNKRKLSTALAFLGDSSIVYLDEPTAGMDPGAKRRIWNTISQERSRGRTIVLTTHSMDECEALCSRAAIMVRGEFKCLGSMQHLKNKFSKGYELTIKVKNAADQHNDDFEENVKRIMLYIVDKFPGAELKETFQTLLIYYVPPSSQTKWSTMFNLLESSKGSLRIEDYSIQQTSLEQVFIAMAKLQ